jgi:probable rRNA maturation factor
MKIKRMINADIVLESNFWKRNINNPKLYINKKLKKIQTFPILKKKLKVFTVLLTDNLKMKYLNKKFRKKNKATDILSFPFQEKKTLETMQKKKNTQIYLGDIIINLNKMILKSKDKDFLLNFDKIWIHGLAHLLGHRHKTNRDFFIMTKLENKLFKLSR